MTSIAFDSRRDVMSDPRTRVTGRWNARAARMKAQVTIHMLFWQLSRQDLH